MKFDTAEKGLLTLFKPYQVALLEHLWDINRVDRTGLNSGQAHEYLQLTGNGELMKSRTSVIFFLNDMVDEDVLGYEEATGKGGYHRVYYPEMNREEFASHVIATITNKLEEVFPSIKRK